jgi:tripartite-type tricarboxylate transporter receptor subunit TctC
MRDPSRAPHSAARRMAVLLTAAIVCYGPTVARSEPVRSAGWPDRTIRMVVPYVAGGAIDVVARVVAKNLGDVLGATVIVDNKPGANGLIGNDIVAKSAPDGYTVLMNGGGFNGTTLLSKKLPYDPDKDFAPISQVARSYGQVLTVNNDVPANNLQEFITLAKAQPGSMNFSSGGEGSIAHLAAALFNHLAGTKMEHVPYKGGGPALQDVISTQITMTFVSTSNGVAPVKAKQVKALAISSPVRSPVLSDVPTFDESGLPGMDRIAGWYGLWFPAGTPQAIVDRVQASVVALVRTPEVKTFFAEAGLAGVASTPAEFRKFMVQDLVDQRELLKIGNVQPQ